MDIVSIGKRIAGRRATLGMKQEDLAEMSGVTTRTIYNIEEGKGNPSFHTLNKLCTILGLAITIDIKQVG